MLGFASIGTAIAFVIDAPHLALLSLRHAQTVGRVIRLIPNSHGLVEIGYSVGGVTYERSVPPYGIALQGPLTAGEEVLVYYYPRNPSIAFAAPAGEILMGQLTPWIGASLGGALFGMWVVFWFGRFRRRDAMALFSPYKRKVG